MQHKTRPIIRFVDHSSKQEGQPVGKVNSLHRHWRGAQVAAPVLPIHKDKLRLLCLFVEGCNSHCKGASSIIEQLPTCLA
jgi:hypothetical protein